MDVRILADTVADRKIVRVGEIVALDRMEARVLIAMGKAEAVTTDDIAIDDVAAAALKVKARARKP